MALVVRIFLIGCYLGLVIIHSKAGLGIPRIICFAWTVKLTLVDIISLIRFRTFIAYIGLYALIYHVGLYTR